MTPTEPKFSAEVAHALAGMKRSEANEIVKSLLAKYIKTRSRMLRWARNIKNALTLREENHPISMPKPMARSKKELEDLGVKFQH